MKLHVPPHSVATYVRGQTVETRPGDLVLVRHHGIDAALIRFISRLRKPRGITWRQWWKFCRVNHACIALEGGYVAQATARGIVVTSVGSMGAHALAVVHVEASLAQRCAELAFARDSVGSGYGFLQIPADLVNAVTGLELALGFGGRMVCSTAAARSLERTDFVPDRTPSCIIPAHLAAYFGAVVDAV